MSPLALTAATLAFLSLINIGRTASLQPQSASAHNFSSSAHHLSQGPSQAASSASHVSLSGSQSIHAASTTAPPAASGSAQGGLDPNALNCKLALPNNALTPEGLSTPWALLPPCSQSVATQQAFAEAAVIDANGQISIYHPLIIDEGKKPQAAPVVPNLGAGSQVALFFGFNGGVLTLVDTHGDDVGTSGPLKKLGCVNGLPGVPGDVFGQVSWCNTQPFWDAANAAQASGKLQVPALGTDDIGKQCPSSRSFEIVDQDQSDNLPTKYLLLSDGSTAQFTAANQAKFPTATEIDNASDEALIADFVDPAIGCTPFKVDSIDDPGTMVSSLATQEFQALIYQSEPIALIPLNDPDTVLTASGAQSRDKTNAYRIGVDMPLLGRGPGTDEGSPQAYCNNLIKIQPPFLKAFQAKFTAVTTPDDGIGNNLFTFLANRFLQSLTNLGCPNQNVDVKCQLNTAGAATACTIGRHHGFHNSTQPHGTGSMPSRPHATGSMPGVPHGTGSMSGAQHGTGSSSEAPHGTGSVSEAPHATDSMSGAPHATGSISGAPHATGSISGAPHATSSIPGAPHATGSIPGKAMPSFSSVPHGPGKYNGNGSNKNLQRVHEVGMGGKRAGTPWFA